MHKIKIVQAGWEGYTGHFGLVEFKDGVSVHPVPQMLADQVTGLIACESVPEEGEDSVALGITTRMVGGFTTTAAPLEDSLATQSERERVAEENLIRLRNAKQASLELHSKQQLESIVDSEGLPGLRKIADLWQVRDRAVAPLIEKILKAQADYQDERAKAETEAKAKADSEQPVQSSEPDQILAALNPEPEDQLELQVEPADDVSAASDPVVAPEPADEPASAVEGEGA